MITTTESVAGRMLPKARASIALRKRGNWVQAVKFGVVGASGYVVNLAVFALLLKGAGVHYLGAATGSFLVAAMNNYIWNRRWTFRGTANPLLTAGLRFLCVSTLAYVGNAAMLAGFVRSGVGVVTAQAVAIILVTPLNFIGNKLWSFRRRG